jgi:acyl-[acyl-carrier-protein]-phospholipid O-acyltransferase / long-chain-fatty-acid--[acyl-carrier-protein] ligase
MLENLLKTALQSVLKKLFRLEIRGVEHFHAAGDRVVIIANHQSYLDPMLLAAFMPQKPAFAMNVFQAQKWYFRWVNRLFTIYKLDPSQPMSLKHLITDLRKGGRVVIFPEGRITTTGGIMKIYDGTSAIIEKTGATVLPVHINGAQFSKFSKLSKKLPQRWFPRISITFMPPEKYTEENPPSSQRIYDLMTAAAFATTDYKKPLLSSLIEAAETYGYGHMLATDINRASLNYRQLFTRAFIVRDKLEKAVVGQTNVAVMLPTALAGAVTFVALHMLGKVPAMLNFSAGLANILHACSVAQVKTVVTSRAFIEKGGLEDVVEGLSAHYTIFYLEDTKPHITLANKLSALARAKAPRRHLAPLLLTISSTQPAVILYTSGSEGTPKGVALSHQNIQCNIAQASSCLDLMPSDILFNALPIFHSFGLTVGMWLPLLRGIFTFYYPSPLHYRVVPELIYDSNATVILGTDTFYNGYAKYAHSYDFQSVRLAVAGAEKLKERTRQLYLDKFGVSIMQGYGVTEASPAISFNTKLQHKVGSVGRPFPGMECKLEPVEGLDKGGRLLVKGDNIMIGYLKADKPGVVQPQGEWYDTGDIVEIDEAGYITILGRAKRFAKIAGEMVSLTAVEDLAFALFADATHAAIAIADERKGEQVVLYTTEGSLTRDALLSIAQQRGVAEITIPRQVLVVEEIPRLGNGKIDYPALNKKHSES